MPKYAGRLFEYGPLRMSRETRTQTTIRHLTKEVCALDESQGSDWSLLHGISFARV